MSSTLSTSSDDRSQQLASGGTDAGGADLDLDAVLGELMHAVANSLHTIAAATDLAELLIARQNTPDATQALARIEPECRRTTRLLRDACAFVAFRVGAAREPVDVVALTRACADAFADRVRIDAGQPLPAPGGDAHALRRAFIEILTNAFQFGANEVRVVFKHVDSTRQLQIDFHDDGRGTRLSSARVLAPFFSTLPDTHSGLGLALAARIASAHGGSVGIAHAAHGGATFRFILPIGAT